MKAKKYLTVDDIQTLSSAIYALCFQAPNNIYWQHLHALILAEIKVKIDKKIAAGIMPLNGIKIMLTPAQIEVLLFIKKQRIFGRFAEFDNAVVKLLQMNK